MTYLGRKKINICTWISVGTRTAKNRGQELGHLAKMTIVACILLFFEQRYIDLYILFTIFVLNMAYLGSK